MHPAILLHYSPVIFILSIYEKSLKCSSAFPDPHSWRTYHLPSPRGAQRKQPNATYTLLGTNDSVLTFYNNSCHNMSLVPNINNLNLNLDIYSGLKISARPQWILLYWTWSGTNSGSTFRPGKQALLTGYLTTEIIKPVLTFISTNLTLKSSMWFLTPKYSVLTTEMLNSLTLTTMFMTSYWSISVYVCNIWSMHIIVIIIIYDLFPSNYLQQNTFEIWN